MADHNLIMIGYGLIAFIGMIFTAYLLARNGESDAVGVFAMAWLVWPIFLCASIPIGCILFATRLGEKHLDRYLD
jgi:hypothetical protein